MSAGVRRNIGEAGFYNAELNGIADSITIIVKNIAKKGRSRKEAEYTSFHDSMTGLYNRRFFSEQLRRLDVSETSSVHHML